jgi:sugar lactone lactonase YvrE
LLSGVVFGESPRWHDGRLWFSDWGGSELIAVDRAGRREIVQRMSTFPFSLGWLPNRRLLYTLLWNGCLRGLPAG